MNDKPLEEKPEEKLKMCQICFKRQLFPCTSTAWAAEKCPNSKIYQAREREFQKHFFKVLYESKNTIPLKFKDATFGSSPNPMARKVESWVRGVIAKTTSTRNLILFGAPGSGKSGAAAAALRLYTTETGKAGEWHKCARLIDAIKRTFDNKGDPFHDGYAGDEMEIITGIQELPIVVLDDFATSFMENSAWQQDRFLRIIDARYETKALTIITMNHSHVRFKGLGDDWERIMSRLGDGGVFLDFGRTDYRASESEPEPKTAKSAGKPKKKSCFFE